MSQQVQGDVVQVFEPNALTLPPLSEYVADVLDRRQFIVELAGAEVRGQRSSTFLGELWSLIDPVFQAAIYFFLFLVIRGGSAFDELSTIIGCVFLFNFTRISIADGGRAILRHKGLVLNAVFPKALLPIAEVYKGFLSTLPALAVYAVLYVVILREPVTQAVLVLPLLMVIQATLNLGFAFLFSTATAYFRDVSNLLQYLLRLLTFATPVIYPVSILPPGIRQVLAFNPLFALFSSYQSVIGGQMPSGGDLFQSIFWALLLFTSGAWVLLRHERSFGLHV